MWKIAAKCENAGKCENYFRQLLLKKYISDRLPFYMPFMRLAVINWDNLPKCVRCEDDQGTRIM